MPSTDAEPTYVKTSDVPLERWNDEKHGRLAWRTVFSADRTPTRAHVCGIAELAPGDELKDHHHAPAEMIYVLSGSGRAVVDGTEHALAPGDAVSVPARAVHSWHAGDDGLRFLYVQDADDFSDVEYTFVNADDDDA